MTKEEKQRGLELQAYADSLKDMTLKEIAIQHLKKYRLPKFLAGLLVKFSYPLLLVKDYKLSELEKENAELKLKLEALEGQTPWKDIKDKSEVIGQLTKAKEIINDCVCELQNILFYKMRNKERIASTLDKAEQFLKESE